MTLRAASASRAWSAFVTLPEEHPAVIALAQASQTRTLAKDAMLLAEASNDTSVFLIVSGVLRSARYTEEGQQVWFTDASEGELIGEIAALTARPRSSTVIAQAKTVILAVEQHAFLSIATAHGEVGLAVARLLANRLVRTSTQVAELVALPVENRLHQELLRMGAAGGGPAESLSATKLGQRIHATREATSRALRDLEARGLIVRQGEHWVISSPVEPDDENYGPAAAARASEPTLVGGNVARKRNAVQPGTKK